MALKEELIHTDGKGIEDHSKNNPEKVYVDEHGRVAWNGLVFDNENQFLIYMRLVQKPFIKWYIKTTGKISAFFSRRK